MARHRPNLSKEIERQLIHQAGNKCANPGCPNRRTHKHHIKQWHVYETHDAKDMIAVCPACHDAIHHGKLPITDETLYGWKNLIRNPDQTLGHIYVEPGASVKLLLGTLAVTGTKGVIPFALPGGGHLELRIVENRIGVLNLRVMSLSGQEVLRVTDNHVLHQKQPSVRYDDVPGHLIITVPASEEYMPNWAMGQMRTQFPDFGAGAEVVLLGLHVLKPGLLRVEGVWAEADRAVVVTRHALSFLRPGLNRPVSMAGDGENSVLHYGGPVGLPLFGVAPETAGNAVAINVFDHTM